MTMDLKPIPKPRSTFATQPVPAPRLHLSSPPPQLPLYQSIDSNLLETKTSKTNEIPEETTTTLLFNVCQNSISEKKISKNLATSTLQQQQQQLLRDEFSEKMTVKDKIALATTTLNASICLQKSMKNLLTKRANSSHNEAATNVDNKREIIDDDGKERCVSLPECDDIFNSISFNSPLLLLLQQPSNMKSIKNEEDLSEARYSLPPPGYPPPPLPDESIYDKLQSVNSRYSGSCNSEFNSSLTSENLQYLSEKFDSSDGSAAAAAAAEHDEFENTSFKREDLLNNISEMKLGDLATTRRFSRSDSWIYYDDSTEDEFSTTTSMILGQEEELEEEASAAASSSLQSDASILSVRNSLYENWNPRGKCDDVATKDSRRRRRQDSKSILIEFDPFAKIIDDNNTTTTTHSISSNDNNDFILLRTLLSKNQSAAIAVSGSNAGSMTRDLGENFDERLKLLEENEQENPPPPAPPRRYDSLPKNEYDEVEIDQDSSSELCNKFIGNEKNLEKHKRIAVIPENSLSSNLLPPLPPQLEFPANKQQQRKLPSVIQKLKKLHDSTVPNVGPVINFMKNRKYKRSIIGLKKPITKDVQKMTKPPPPQVNTQLVVARNVCHRGIVYRPGIGIERTTKELVMRFAILQDGKITFYTDKGMSTVKETLLLDNVQSIHLLQDVKVVDGEQVHCVAVSSGHQQAAAAKGRLLVHIFYIRGMTERRIWAQRILEALTPIFPIKYTSDFIRAGWAHLKEGITGIWFPAWVLLQQRTCIYTRSRSEQQQPLEFEKVDLRKARCILIRDLEGPLPPTAAAAAINSNTTTNRVLIIDSAGGGGGSSSTATASTAAALHLTAQDTREISAWRQELYQAAINCGPALSDQQLTTDNVPVIVDKCINFIYRHGIMSEGIYRKGGSSSAVVRLLETFRKDAWAIQITRGLYSEHDVASVLRRFLRDLPEPLIPSSIYESLCRAIVDHDVYNPLEKRIEVYRTILFPVLNQSVAGSTLRRILAHLHCLSQQCSRNRMTVENISAIWGPTLLHAGRNNAAAIVAEEWNKSDNTVVCDLIRFYPELYQLSPADLAKEARILEVLERHHISNSTLCGSSRGTPSAGDIKIWIYLFERENGECCNVTIGPQKTASDVCKELSEKSKVPAHELCLEEYTLDGALRRPLHYAEKVLEVIARWGYCDPEDRKDNMLILKTDAFYKNIVSRIKPPMTVSGELLFGDKKTKNFKSLTFEFSQAKLFCYKDKACSVKLHEWKIEDIIWYLGHEPKRNPQMGWSITFILKNEKMIRTKDAPFFGYILAGAPPVDQYKWLAAMLFGQYQWNLFPSVVNLMDP